MRTRSLRRSSAIALPLALLLAAAPAAGREITAGAQPGQARSAGARWLVEHQNADGGWGAGGHGSRGAVAASDVATTALSVMALLRDGGASAGHRSAIEKGVGFVLDAIEASPAEGPRLRGPQSTQPQYKLGRNVDTHFAALLLGELPRTLSEAVYTRAQVAYDKVLTKVAAAQQLDGGFDKDGWAPVLSSSVAAQSLYKAHQNGKKVSQEVLERSDDYQRELVDTRTGRFDASAGAGVDLYAAATSLRGNSQAANRAPGEQGERAQQAAEATRKAVRSDAARLIAGFGSIGGEEMLSYMMISDALAEEGGDDWKSWERKIGGHLAATQNADGSWSGHHCITSTPFVTAAAVMTLGSGTGIQQASATR